MPKTMSQFEDELRNPSFCELLPIRAFLDNVMIRDNGSFIAGYRLNGSRTYFASDEERNHLKFLIESLLLVLPEESMRIQFRYEVIEGVTPTLDRYRDERSTSNSQAIGLDEERIDKWKRNDEEGSFQTRVCAVYLIWNPEKHRKAMAMSGQSATTQSQKKTKQPQTLKEIWEEIKGTVAGFFSGASVAKSIERTRAEHLENLSQFEAILHGVETSLRNANVGPERMTHDEMFLEVKRAINPLFPDTKPLVDYQSSIRYVSPREQMATSALLESKEAYINIGGLLWSTVSMKLPPDATQPGMLRRLLTLGFPVVISTQVMIPDQHKVLDVYKKRYKRMQSSLSDGKGGVRADMTAKVAAQELLGIQEKIIASSAKTVQVSVTLAIRSSRPAYTEADYEAAVQELAGRTQKVMHIVGGLNGARGYQESLACRRLFFNTLPGLADEDKRSMDLLTEHAADLIPIETPYGGTEDDYSMLFETPYRQLIPVSHFSPGLENANMILAATSGTGKGMLVGKMLMTYGRKDARISILERGDSYASAIEYMGGTMITMSLDSPHVINPFDLEQGATEPSNDHVSFLKNLIRFMVGENGNYDPDILDSVILLSIKAAYARAANRIDPIPTLSDVRDELVTFNDKGKSQRVNDEAKIAAGKLRPWVDDGMYAKLFDRKTTVKMDSQWLYFNIEQLKDDPKLEAAMSLLIAYATTKRGIGSGREKSITALDECWALLEKGILAPVVVQMFRTARKRNACVWGISQAIADFTGTPDRPNPLGEAILTTTAMKIIGRQKGNTDVLRHYLHLNDTQINTITSLRMTEKGKQSTFLGMIGEKVESTFLFNVKPTPREYWIMTTYAREKDFRRYFREMHRDMSIEAQYRLLAEKYPEGIAALPQLPEEKSGEVWSLFDERRGVA